MNLVQNFLLDDWLVNFVDHWLMVLMNDILCVLFDDVLVVFMDNVLVLSVNDRLRVFLLVDWGLLVALVDGLDLRPTLLLLLLLVHDHLRLASDLMDDRLSLLRFGLLLLNFNLLLGWLGNANLLS